MEKIGFYLLSLQKNGGLMVFIFAYIIFVFSILIIQNENVVPFFIIVAAYFLSVVLILFLVLIYL